MRSRHSAVRAGYTLVEMLVATFVFVLLGTMLVQAVVGGVNAWRMAEARRQVYERAQRLFSTMEEDIASTFCVWQRGAVLDDPEIRLRLGRDPGGNSELRLVRTIAGELSREETRHAGDLAGAQDHRNLHGDHRKRLLAGEGLEEVLYVVRESGVLWRGIRSPVGGPGSLMGLDLQARANTPEDPMHEVARPFVPGVLHLGIAAWDPGHTQSWLSAPGQQGGPAVEWDSSTRQGAYPPLLRVTLVLACDPILARTTRLSTAVGPGDVTLTVERLAGLPEPGTGGAYVKVGTEWIRYEDRDLQGQRLLGCVRGQRGTRPQPHTVGSRVDVGYTFVTVHRLRGIP